MIVEEGKHYLYRHIRLDNNKVFYIGIGTKQKKDLYGRAYNKTKRNNYWKRIVNKTEYKIDIILESDDYEFIKEKEIEFISLYGRKDLGLGSLVNMTYGGQGMLGYVPTEETKKIMSEKKKGENNPMYGKDFSKEHKNKLSDANKGENNPMYGKKHKYESIIKNRKSNINKVVTEETKLKLSKRTKFINISTNEEHIFESLKKGSDFFNIDYTACKKVANGNYYTRNKNGKVKLESVKGFKIIYI